MSLKPFAALALAAAFAAPASAAKLVAAGVFGGSAPTNAFFAPGRSWSFEADVPDVVTLDGYNAVAALTVRLDGVAIALENPEVAFFTAADYGLFGLRFRQGDERFGWDLTGPQVFNDALALVAGTYAVNLDWSGAWRQVWQPEAEWWDGRDWEGFAEGQTVRVVASAVPEPATWALMILGFGLVGTAARRASRRSAGAA